MSRHKRYRTRVDWPKVAAWVAGFGGSLALYVWLFLTLAR